MSGFHYLRHQRARSEGSGKSCFNSNHWDCLNHRIVGNVGSGRCWFVYVYVYVSNSPSDHWYASNWNDSNRYKKLTLGASVTKTGWLPPTRVDCHYQDAQISSHSPCLNSPACGVRSFPRPLFWPRNWDHWRKLGLLQRGQHLHQDCQHLFLRWLWDGSLRKNWISIQWTVQCDWSRLGL